MQQVRTCDVVSGEAERPPSARVREVRFEGHGEGLFNIRRQVGNVVILQLKLPDRNLPAFMK